MFAGLKNKLGEAHCADQLTLSCISVFLFKNIVNYKVIPLYRFCHSSFLGELWQEYTQQLYRKDLHNPDNHDGVITHLEPDILECEVKWALESNTMNKASGGDGIPVELFQILKDDAVKVLHSTCQ